MGCFNIAGFFTNQVIRYGEPVVVFPCCEFDIKNRRGDIHHYAIPLSMPIFGKYNDYGSVEEIEKSAVTKKLEEFFGYDIEDIVDDVVDFTVDKWWGIGEEGRYEQIKGLRQEDPNDSFMKEEFDRYAPKFETLRDLVTETCNFNEADTESLAYSLALTLSERENIPLEEVLKETKKNHTKPLEKENFNVFLAIDHAALWKAFTKIYDEDDRYYYENLDLSEIKERCCLMNDEYDGSYKSVPGLEKYTLYLCDETSMETDFKKFVSIAYHNLNFKFKLPNHYGQDYDSDEYANLNKMILEDTEE